MNRAVGLDSFDDAETDAGVRAGLHRRPALVVDVKRDSQADGPGTRSVVFFKGCPLRCTFCQNPETQDPRAEVAFSRAKCVECGRCVEACPRGAATLELPERIRRERCTRCGTCAEACPTGALRCIGTSYEVRALAEVLLRDFLFYKHTHGGVTLSGGEPTLWPDYVESLLQLLKANNVHVVLETCGHFHYETFRRKLLPYLDLVYFDVKLADPEAHRRHTGKSNRRILDNLRRLLAEPAVEVQPRVPLVPEVTATRENLAAVVDLLCDAGADSVQLLPYNPLGLEMFEALGRPRPPVSDHFLKPDELAQLYEAFRQILERTASGRRLTCQRASRRPPAAPTCFTDTARFHTSGPKTCDNVC